MDFAFDLLLFFTLGSTGPKNMTDFQKGRKYEF